NSTAPSGPPAPSALPTGAGKAAPAVGSRRGPGRTVAVITAVAAGLLALLHGMDLLQGLLGLPYTVHDLWMMMCRADVAEGDFVLQVPLNLVQAAVFLVLSVMVFLGSLM